MPERMSKININHGEPTFMLISEAAKPAEQYLKKGKEIEEPMIKSTSTSENTSRYNGVRILGEETPRAAPKVRAVKPTQQSFSKVTPSIVSALQSHSFHGLPSSKSGVKQVQRLQSSKWIPPYPQVRILESGARCSICREGYRSPTLNDLEDIKWSTIYNCPKCLSFYHVGCVKCTSCPTCVARDRPIPTVEAPIPTVEAAIPTVEASISTVEAPAPTVKAFVSNMKALVPTVKAHVLTAHLNSHFRKYAKFAGTVKDYILD
jgi:hypothetical protein